MKVVWRQDSNAMATRLHTNKSTSTGFLCMSRKRTYNLLSCNLNHTKHFMKVFHNQTADMLLNPSPAAMTQHFKLPSNLPHFTEYKQVKPKSPPVTSGTILPFITQQGMWSVAESESSVPYS